MNKNTFYGIASFTTFGGALVNLYNTMNNLYVYDMAQSFLKKSPSFLIEVSNNYNQTGLYGFLSDTLKRSANIEFFTSGLLFATTIYFADKWRKERSNKTPKNLETLTLDIDNI